GSGNRSCANARAGVQASLDSQVMETVDQLRKAFARTIQPPLPGCLAYQLRQSPGVVAVSVERIDFPKVAPVSAAFRAAITVRTKGRTARLVTDFVFFGNGRLEYSLNVL